MNNASLEHVNITVSNPEKTAGLICQLFDWHIRWQGPSMLGGYTFHVGTDDSYIAVYGRDRHGARKKSAAPNKGVLNHIGIVVDDLNATEQQIKGADMSG